jgi:Xaa-Pro aminopeptidase
VDSVEAALVEAQRKAERLFDDVVRSGLIRPGVLDSEVSKGIDAIARRDYGLKRHWHKRIVRSGPATLLGYYDKVTDRRIEADDLVMLDLGPLFGEWEADFGRTYVLGDDPRRHRLVADVMQAFARGKAFFEATPGLTAGGLYDHVCGLAAEAGWEFGAPTAGHLVGRFPHETSADVSHKLSIRHGNPLDLRAPDATGAKRHWILEIHFVDRAAELGAFTEELLTTPAANL